MGKEMSNLLFFLAASRSKSAVDFNATMQPKEPREVRTTTTQHSVCRKHYRERGAERGYRGKTHQGCLGTYLINYQRHATKNRTATFHPLYITENQQKKPNTLFPPILFLSGLPFYRPNTMFFLYGEGIRLPASSPLSLPNMNAFFICIGRALFRPSLNSEPPQPRKCRCPKKIPNCAAGRGDISRHIKRLPYLFFEYSANPSFGVAGIGYRGGRGEAGSLLYPLPSSSF